MIDGIIGSRQVFICANKPRKSGLYSVTQPSTMAWLAVAALVVLTHAHVNLFLGTPVFPVLALRYAKCRLQIIYLRLQITYFFRMVCAFFCRRCLRLQIFFYDN